MAFKFPFTNYHELNLTWVLEQLKKLFEESEENVETIETYDNRLSAVETEVTDLSSTTTQAINTANAAATNAATALSRANTANENSLTASSQAGAAVTAAQGAMQEAQAATQTAQQAQATAMTFDGRITQAEHDSSVAIHEAQSFENRVNAAINTANNAANTATIAQGIAVNANQTAAQALDELNAQRDELESIAAGLIEDINDEADAEKQDIQDLANSVLASIPSDYTELSNKVNNPVNGLDTKAPVIINNTSGNIASFKDGADSMSVREMLATIEPLQDLHGYNKPWAGGTGKNLLVQNLQIIKAANLSGTWNENVYTYGGLTFTVNVDESDNISSIIISGTVDSSDVFFYFFRSSQGVTFNAGSYICSGYGAGYKMRIGQGESDTIIGNVSSNGGFTLENNSICSVAFRFQNMSGTAVNDTVYPMIRLSSVADATFEPYSNICHINGWSGLNGVRTGKNVFPFNLTTLKAANTAGVWSDNVYSYQGLTYTVIADGNGNVIQINVSGTLTAADHFFYIGGRGQSARTHIMKSGSYIATGYSTPYKLRVGKGIENAYVGNFDSGSIVNLNGTIFEFGLRIQNATGQVINTILHPMLRLATDTDSTYEPPYAITIPVTWQTQAGTVYGGTLELITGVLTATDAEIANYNGEVLPSTWISDRDLYAVGTTPTTGAQVVYKLSASLTYQINPATFNSLYGNNIIYTDCGPVSVKYPADTKLYIDGKIVELQALVLEN